ncbi:DnaD domain protein [Thermoflavimicrobium dichotomicum]|uniref:Replicative DNA helicase loader DnaB n=1 Tax=Thermoflavimicrobium dichotomicum TaxID=46223 RepID=A0A1I3L9J5_9BACL|nr:DnaD domain protein [Thermoflavimicrobium dichotomicum]SFI81371.1 replicative DNA helicase loader DnaB [Thermoflavimicrobium dichotomicum]
MAMFWQGYGWRCRTHRPLHSTDLLVLTHLYQPIVGTCAIGLYITLYHQLPLHRAGVSEIHPQSYLLKLLSLSSKQIIEARHLLEGVGLLNTYEKKDLKDGCYYEFELIPPLSPVKFFHSEIFSLTLYNLLGKDRYMELQKMFIQPKSVESIQSSKNITKSFREVFGSLSPREMQKAAEIQKDLEPWEHMDDHLAEGKFPEWSDDDLSVIKLHLSTQLDPRIWTKELEAELKEICFLYQLDAWDLLKVLQDPTITGRGKIDMDRLRSFVKSEYQFRFGNSPMVSKRIHPRQLESAKPNVDDSPIQEPLTEEDRYFQQLATISPLELLSFYHDGAKIPDCDVDLVESLIRDYGLPHGVVNVLLDYVLQKHDRKLPRSLVQKIAGHWKRLGISTVEQAREQARKEMRNGKRQQQETKRKERQGVIPLAKSKQLERPSKVLQPMEPVVQMSDEDLLKKQAQIKAKLSLMREQQKRVWREEERTP